MSEKITFAKAQISETKDIMVKNISSLLERGERLDDLDVKTQMLSETSEGFNRSGRMVRDNMCSSVAILLLILIVLGATVFFIYEIVKHV